MPKPATAILSFLYSAIVFSSCSGKKEDKIITLLQSSLVSSNKAINVSTASLLKELEDKKYDFCTKERAEIWFPKAETIANKVKSFYDFLEEEKLHANDKTLITDKLVRFRDEMFAIDSQFIEISGNSFDFIKKFIWVSGGDTLLKTNFFNSNSRLNSSTAILTMLQNEIKKIENRLIAFCNLKVGFIDDSFYSYSAILGQNSTILKPGETLEITAGMGAFSANGKPTIVINGQNILLGEEGFSRFRTKTQNIPGHYRIPVQIKFTNQITGKEETLSKNVEYTVAKECDQ